ncbi:hypothetical protein JYU34_007872 [Plutella xylostella]|uniref:Uncharacterized protein n=1 Tax=Plutella xylostella TaxID=51655 RepID=A0ABQ7QRG2_PLUXY|nr:hypothetical protein JYU34_007872 [Plutella xylostella]
MPVPGTGSRFRVNTRWSVLALALGDRCAHLAHAANCTRPRWRGTPPTVPGPAGEHGADCTAYSSLVMVIHADMARSGVDVTGHGQGRPTPPRGSPLVTEPPRSALWEQE